MRILALSGSRGRRRFNRFMAREPRGPNGTCVVATDIDPKFLEPLAARNVGEVRKHNIVTDPLPDASFLTSFMRRLVLVHLPEREKALSRLASALKRVVGLVDEELDSISLLPDPAASPGEVILNTQTAVMRFLKKDRGVELRFGRLLYEVGLRAHGFVEVGAEGLARLSMWRGGSSDVSLMRTNFRQLRGPLLDRVYRRSRSCPRPCAPGRSGFHGSVPHYVDGVGTPTIGVT